MPDSDIFNLIISFMERMLSPLQAGLTKVSESLVELSSQVKDISTVMRQEPTRQTIVNEVRSLLKEHDNNFELQLREHNRECANRNERIDDNSDERAQKILTDALAALSKVQAGVGNVGKMGEKFDSLSKTIKVSVGIVLAAAGYLAWALEHSK